MREDRFEEILKDKFRDFEPESSSASSSDWMLLSQAIVSKKILLGSALLGKLLLSPKSSIYVVKAAATTAAVTAAVATTVYLVNNSEVKNSDKPIYKQENQITQEQDSIPPEVEAVEIFKRELAKINEKKQTSTMPQDSDEDIRTQIMFSDNRPVVQEVKKEKSPKKDVVQPQPKPQRISNWSLALFTDRALSSIAEGPKPNAVADNTLIAHKESTKNLITTVENAKIKHNIPITVGISLKRNLINNWAIETGVTYSYLSSNAKLNTTFDYEMKQKMHYIGIPLGVTYTALRSEKWDLYGRFGVQADFNVGSQRTVIVRSEDGEMATYRDNSRIKEIQWSAAIGAGVTYNITPEFGVYIEPNIVHYISNDAPVETFWSKNPTNLNVKLGVRKKF